MLEMEFLKTEFNDFMQDECACNCSVSLIITPPQRCNAVAAGVLNFLSSEETSRLGLLTQQHLAEYFLSPGERKEFVGELCEPRNSREGSTEMAGVACQ